MRVNLSLMSSYQRNNSICSFYNLFTEISESFISGIAVATRNSLTKIEVEE